MRKCHPIRLAALVVSLLAPAAAHAERDAGIGIALSVPDIVGLTVSIYPHNTVSLDAHLSLIAAEGGVTGHIPVGGSWTGFRHDVLVSGGAGWVHELVHSPILSYNGLRLKALVGYGLLSSAWDFRVLAGIALEPTGGRWVPIPAAMLALAKVF